MKNHGFIPPINPNKKDWEDQDLQRGAVFAYTSYVKGAKLVGLSLVCDRDAQGYKFFLDRKTAQLLADNLNDILEMTK